VTRHGAPGVPTEMDEKALSAQRRRRAMLSVSESKNPRSAVFTASIYVC
jgi:hypothetical protein